MDAPLLLFGGPYSNLQATEAVLAEARRRHIPPHRIVCTGDVVAYGGDPKACVDLIRRSGIQIVMGNCEEQLAADADDCGCGFAPGSECDRLSAAWFTFARSELDADDRAWMATLPRSLPVEIAGLRLVAVHGSLGEISRFVFASTPTRIKALDVTLAGADGIIGGHCGLPFTQSIGDGLWHNPGVVGMPANDGTPRVWYSVIEPGPEPPLARCAGRDFRKDTQTPYRQGSGRIATSCLRARPSLKDAPCRSGRSTGARADPARSGPRRLNRPRLRPTNSRILASRPRATGAQR